MSKASRTALEMEQQQAKKIRQAFLDVLDTASENYKNLNSTKGTAEVRKSVKLGKFADVNVKSEQELKYFNIGNSTKKLNDYVGIQKRVIAKLNNDNFFNVQNRNIILNVDSNIIVEIGAEGIRETLSSGKRYKHLSAKIQKAKIATIRYLPEMIKYAEIVELNQSNYHGNPMADFLVLSHPAVVDGVKYDIEIKVKKTPQKNKFYIHNLSLKKEINTTHVEENAINSDITSLNSSDLSLENTISQNNTDVKFSIDVNRLKEKFSDSLTAGEWKKYNYAMASKVDAGLRISDNAILVEGEKGEFNYKLVIYDDSFEDKPITAVYGIGEAGFHQDITNFDAKNVAQYILKIEGRKYDRQEISDRLLGNYAESFGLVLGRYSPKSIRYNEIKPKPYKNKRNIGNSSERRGILGEDREDVKHSVDVDDFDDAGYNILNITHENKYKKLRSEIMTWDADRHLDKVRAGYLGGAFNIYKMTSDDVRSVYIYKPKSKLAKTRYKELKISYDKSRNVRRLDNIVESIENKRNGISNNNDLFRGQSGKSRESDRFDNKAVSKGRNSDNRRSFENDSDDNLQERQSIDISHSEYAELKRENKKLSIDVDDFDEKDYTYPKLSRKEYDHLKSEILTNFSRVKNKVNYIKLISRNSTYYYILDDYYDVIVLYKTKIGDIHKERKNANRTSVGNGGKNGNVGSRRRNNQRNISGINNTETTEINDKIFGKEISTKRKSNKRGYAENGNNADSREEKSSIDISHSEYAELKRENKKLKEVNELLRHEFELTGSRETNAHAAVVIGRKIKNMYNTSISGVEIGRDLKTMSDRVMADEYRSYDTLYNEASAIAEKIVDSMKTEY